MRAAGHLTEITRVGLHPPKTDSDGLKTNRQEQSFSQIALAYILVSILITQLNSEQRYRNHQNATGLFSSKYLFRAAFTPFSDFSTSGIVRVSDL